MAAKRLTNSRGTTLLKCLCRPASKSGDKPYLGIHCTFVNFSVGIHDVLGVRIERQRYRLSAMSLTCNGYASRQP